MLDIYADPRDGAVLWLLDEGGERRRLKQAFPVTFYAAGPAPRLRLLWRFLQAQPVALRLSRCQRRDLFQPQPLSLLAAEVAQPAAQPDLFQKAAAAFPDLTYYDADLPLALRHAALYGTFPLARCRVAVDAGGNVQALQVLDSPWDLDPPPAPLRILSIEPNVDPFHAEPTHLLVRAGRGTYRLALEPARPLLVNLRAILLRHDPDLLLTAWGDTWLLPRLLDCTRQYKLPLPLNRDPGRGPARREERSYFSYGQVIHRGQQIHMFGRWHIDIYNAMLFHDYEIEGVLELARVTALPAQTVARTSPGSGISAMQMLTALRQGVLVPWRKQQAERPKSALQLLSFDQGGLVYQPTIGLHRDVAEIDFISMYPSIMARFNISPETVSNGLVESELVETGNVLAGENAGLGLRIEREVEGLVPRTLSPLLEKRLALKLRLAEMPAWDPRRTAYKARASAHKWLLVTCFGYLGYKNARFGRIEAHEAVTTFGREMLLVAKETVEAQGFEVLHMYVDGLWVKKEGCSKAADFQPALEAISERTGLPIALDGIYRWVAFLPSRVDRRVPVPNRYFGVFQDGSLKLRGIEARRRDTPPFIAQAQLDLLALLAEAPEAACLDERIPQAVALLRRRLAELRQGRIPLERLLVAQKLSRELAEYCQRSRMPPTSVAAAQLAAVGKHLRPGQLVRFLYTRGEPGARAWDLPSKPDPRSLDLARYAELLLRAAFSVLQPLGVEQATLRLWLSGGYGWGSHQPCLPIRAALGR